MNEQNIIKIVTAHGTIWRNLTLYSSEDGIFGMMTEATPSYLSDRRIEFTDETSHDEAMEMLVKIDSDTDDHLSLYAEEG